MVKNNFIKLLLFTLLDVLDIVLRLYVAAWQSSRLESPAGNSSVKDIPTHDSGSVIIWILASWTLICHSFVFGLRLHGYLSQKSVLTKGFSKQWNTARALSKHRILANRSMQEHALSVEALRDYRLVRDDEARKLRNSVAQTLDAVLCSFPWIIANFIIGTDDGATESSELSIAGKTSLVVVGASIGLKMISMLSVLEYVRKYRSAQILATSLVEEREGLVVTATSQSTKQDAVEAVNEAYTELLIELGRQNSLQVLKQPGPVLPNFIVMAVSAECKGTDVLSSLHCLHNKVSVVGFTSAFGLMNETVSLNPISDDARPDEEGKNFVGMFGVSDPDGLYISHAVSFEELFDSSSSEQEIENIVTRKVQDECESILMEKFPKLLHDGHWLLSYNMVRSPSFIWMNATSNEDLVIKGFHRVFGSKVVIVGGTAADRTFTGKQKVYSISVSTERENQIQSAESNGVSFCIGWSSVETVTSFSSGFTETGLSGRVTKLGKRRNELCEINGTSAGLVYDRWTAGMLLSKYESQSKTKLRNEELADLSSSKIVTDHTDYVIIKESTPQPLAVRMGSYNDGESYWKILHPSHWLQNNSIVCAANMNVGDEISLMYGTRANLISRLSVMAKGIVSYLSKELVDDKKLGLQKRNNEAARLYAAGMLAVYCGGCAQHVGSGGIQTVSEKLSQEIPNVPFFGAFTYGEQGIWPNGQAGHGNLMFSLLVFTRRRLVTSVLNVETGRILNEGDHDFNASLGIHPGLRELFRHCQKVRKSGATIMNRSNLNVPVRTFSPASKSSESPYRIVKSSV